MNARAAARPQLAGWPAHHDRVGNDEVALLQWLRSDHHVEECRAALASSHDPPGARQAALVRGTPLRQHATCPLVSCPLLDAEEARRRVCPAAREEDDIERHRLLQEASRNSQVGLLDHELAPPVRQPHCVRAAQILVVLGRGQRPRAVRSEHLHGLCGEGTIHLVSRVQRPTRGARFLGRAWEASAHGPVGVCSQLASPRPKSHRRRRVESTAKPQALVPARRARRRPQGWAALR
eukprot:677414-Prymnesium_polylepis.2